MKQVFLFLFIFLGVPMTEAQQLFFSDSAVVSLITCSAGEKVYEMFGHTALRVRDSKTDVVFNYGVFDFNTPNFYPKFVKGETDYQLGVSNTSLFLASYSMGNFLVWEQVLLLTNAEKKTLINTLIKNYEPENRLYRYNFIFDNCATRPVEKIIESTHGYINFTTSLEPKTYRQWVESYLKNDAWLNVGIDLLFGIEADHLATTNESMFLPEVLMTEFQTATIVSSNGQARKIVADRLVLIDDSKNAPTDLHLKPLIEPFTGTLILLVIGLLLTFWDVYRHRQSKLFDSMLFISTGILGVVLAYLMFFSIQPLVKMNLNILWLNPLNLIAGCLIWIRNRKWRIALFFYQMLNILFLIGSLLAFALSIQHVNLASFPIIVLLLIRSASWFAYLKRRLYKHIGTNKTTLFN